RLVIDADLALDAVAHALVQLVGAPFRRGDAEHWHCQRALLDHGVERWKDLLAGEVAGEAEDHQRVGMVMVHLSPHAGGCATALPPEQAFAPRDGPAALILPSPSASRGGRRRHGAS